MKLGQDIVLVICIQLWILKESDCQEGYCNRDKPDTVVNICTNSELSMTIDAYLDTVNVPKFQQTFCECIIAPSYDGHDEVNFSFFLSGRYSKSMQFKINDIVLNFTYRRAITYITDETTLYFSTDENNTKEEACLYLYTHRRTKFNITCTKPKRIITTTLVTDATTSVTSEDTDSITVPVTTAYTATDISKENITKHTQNSKSGLDSSGKLTEIVVPTVIGALLILTASVILLVYFKRRRLAKETGLHQQELHPTPALSEPVTEQGQDEQNITSGERCGPNISVNPYERLNMYVNDTLAGEMYQQLETDKTEENQKLHDVKNSSGNQDRHFSKETVFQEGKGQENNSNETSPNAYERLNMYVNDTLAGEMYQQLQTDQTVNVLGKSVPGSERRKVIRSDRTTGTNENTSAIYTNAISQGDDYDDIA